MSQVIDLCEDSDDGEWLNTASGPSLQLSGKRSRDNEESFNYAHLCNENGSVNKTATISSEFIVNLEPADEVEVSPPKKRRSVVRSEPSVKNDAAGLCMQNLKGVHAPETDVDSEDSEQTSRNNGSTNTNSQKLSTSNTPLNASGRQRRVSAWVACLSELADYSKIHGHCNVPRSYSENTKLGACVGTQKKQYQLHLKGKRSQITPARIQALESLGFEWKASIGRGGRETKETKTGR
jgi:hypothetical protein